MLYLLCKTALEAINPAADGPENGRLAMSTASCTQTPLLRPTVTAGCFGVLPFMLWFQCQALSAADGGKGAVQADQPIWSSMDT